jgi:hypothetical protein
VQSTHTLNHCAQGTTPPSQTLYQFLKFIVSIVECALGAFPEDIVIALSSLQTCFEALRVVCQYPIDYDMPLYAVLIEDIIEED